MKFLRPLLVSVLFCAVGAQQQLRHKERALNTKADGVDYVEVEEAMDIEYASETGKNSKGGKSSKSDPSSKGGKSEKKAVPYSPGMETKASKTAVSYSDVTVTKSSKKNVEYTAEMGKIAKKGNSEDVTYDEAVGSKGSKNCNGAKTSKKDSSSPSSSKGSKSPGSGKGSKAESGKGSKADTDSKGVKKGESVTYVEARQVSQRRLGANPEYDDEECPEDDDSEAYQPIPTMPSPLPAPVSAPYASPTEPATTMAPDWKPPTLAPVWRPAPTKAPYLESPPTKAPASEPLNMPTMAPVEGSENISEMPTTAPASDPPSIVPVSDSPSMAPAEGTEDISEAPTLAPVTDAPTLAPVTDAPSLAPVTDAPSLAPVTDAPSLAPVTDAPSLAPVTENTSKNLVEIAVDTPELSTLVSLLSDPAQEELLFALMGEGSITVFAPNNDAFAKLADLDIDLGSADAETITIILAYHATDLSLPSSAITTGFIIAANGNGLYIKKQSTGNIVINSNANVVTPDIVASNGVIHIIDQVLLPPALDVIEVASNNADFSILVELIIKAGYLDILSGGGPYTVFAPTNAAFLKLGQATIDALKEDLDALTNVILYHVTSGYVGSGQLVGGPEIVTLADGATIRVRSNGLVLNDVARFELTDIIATNGVVHVIDTVLIPPAMSDPA